MTSAGLLSLAVQFPSVVRGNDYFTTRYPDLVEAAESRALAKLFNGEVVENEFDRAMQPYLKDPFRGTVERRVLGAEETSVGLECGAARQALEAAGLGPGDIDCLISTSFLPDTLGVGNAVFVARDLGLRCEAWNLETACSGSVVALRNAAALVRAGEHRRILVTVSCTYSRTAVASDSLGWFVGDGAAAFIVGAAPDGFGYLGGKAVHTANTCGTWYYELEISDGRPRIAMRATRETGRVLSHTATPYLRECVEGAAAAAGVRIEDIDFFAVNTPTAWFADFVAHELHIDPERTVSTYASFANTGPVLMPTNLHYAASQGRIKPNDLVMLFSIGSVSSASAAVLRWTDVKLGPLPPGIAMG
jgi:3-oxoacyl-[acyl-carrier-protein] synthase-3